MRAVCVCVSEACDCVPMRLVLLCVACAHVRVRRGRSEATVLETGPEVLFHAKALLRYGEVRGGGG